MRNKKCLIENKKMIDFLKNLPKRRLEKIAKNLKIEDYHKLSKEKLIQKIRDLFPEEWWIVNIPKNSLTEFLIYLPGDIKEFTSTLTEGDSECPSGIWEIEKLREKYGNKTDSWLKTLESYGIVFKVKKENKTYSVIPEDIWSGLLNVLSSLETPKNVEFEEFLTKYLNKYDLQHICRVYGLKVSGTKKELANNMMEYGLTPKDVLSVMYFEDLVDLSEKLDIYPFEERNLKKIDRNVLIDDLASHILHESQDKKISKRLSTKHNIFDILMDLVSHKFIPILKWNSDESDIEKQLVEYLSGFFECSNIDTRFISQYRLPSGGIIDIYEIKNDIGIELKYNPTRTHLRETVQRVREYREDVHKIIVAIFYQAYSYSDTEMLKKYTGILKKISGVTVIIREV